jgi:hypothetical protein
MPYFLCRLRPKFDAMLDRIFHPKTFTKAFCAQDQATTPHCAGMVLAQRESLVEVELHCRKCAAKVLYSIDKLPEGYRVYQVRVTGEDNPILPPSIRSQPLPYLEEEFAVVAASAQGAHEAAEWATGLTFKGHSVRWYIDGTFHPDDRF